MGKVFGDAWRYPRWIAALAILGVSLAGLFREWFDVCKVETIDAAKTVTTMTCSQPVVTDAGVVATALLIFLLIAPDMSEVGIFGLSLKRRVQAAEQNASDSKVKTDLLENRVHVQDARIDSVSQSVATAASHASVGPILIGDKAIEHALSGLPEKAQAFQSGQGTPLEQESDSVDPQKATSLIQNWELIAASLDLPPYRFRRGPTTRRIPLTADLASRFASVFADELQIVRAARNTVAHAGLIGADELNSAVEISESLLGILREGAARDASGADGPTSPT